ncbi:MAG: class I SAM-dependent methyltransferase [Solirubrobacteraceae bacterium]
MASIGPTAHYTGHVWSRHGLSHPELATAEGRALYLAAEAALLPLRLLRQPTIEDFLLARHLVIDAQLEAAIAEGRVGQVLEIACGMSPRGWRFTSRHPELVYVEADLPGMAGRKRTALRRIGRPAGHRVVALDALAESGPRSLAAVAAAELDPGLGLAVITEGLLNYLSRDAVQRLWSNVAPLADLYLSDLFVAEDSPAVIGRAFSAALAAFVRSPVSLHFADAADAETALRAAGFASASVSRATDHPAAPSGRGAGLVRIVRAQGSPTAT